MAARSVNLRTKPRVESFIFANSFVSLTSRQAQRFALPGRWLPPNLRKLREGWGTRKNQQSQHRRNPSMRQPTRKPRVPAPKPCGRPELQIPEPRPTLVLVAAAVHL